MRLASITDTMNTGQGGQNAMQNAAALAQGEQYNSCLAAGGFYDTTLYYDKVNGGYHRGRCIMLQRSAPQPQSAPVTVTVSPAIQTTVSPQISPAFQQAFQPSNSPMSAATRQTAPVSNQASTPPPPVPVVSAGAYPVTPMSPVPSAPAYYPPPPSYSPAQYVPAPSYSSAPLPAVSPVSAPASLPLAAPVSTVATLAKSPLVWVAIVILGGGVLLLANRKGKK